MAARRRRHAKTGMPRRTCVRCERRRAAPGRLVCRLCRILIETGVA
ncbi:MAG TPA: hypothetical protein VFL91_08255 [Thermomicrobiales bacterium]|nr:hypothetical protein [Thermomicrobiales bacterium]